MEWGKIQKKDQIFAQLCLARRDSVKRHGQDNNNKNNILKSKSTKRHCYCYYRHEPSKRYGNNRHRCWYTIHYTYNTYPFKNGQLCQGHALFTLLSVRFFFSFFYTIARNKNNTQ